MALTEIPSELSSTPSIVDGGNATAITIDSSERVGISNSNPSEMLTIGSTSDTNVRVQFLSSTTGGNTIQFGDGTGAAAYRGYINYTHSDDVLAFATGGSEAMKLDSSGSLLINSSATADTGGNKLFINSGVNALPATSGTTQTGGALRLRGANNAVLDMGLNSVYTWIQATDKANLANGYSLSLNPNGGNVGIGGSIPLSKMHIFGNGSVRNNFQAALIVDGGVSVANPYTGHGTGIDFKGRDYSNAVRNYAAINAIMVGNNSHSTTAGDAGFSSALTFTTNGGGASGTNPTERLRILPTGGITFNGDTAQANALNDYEEGSFTTVAAGVNGSGYNPTMRYTKVGCLVNITARILWTGTANTTTGLNFTLPFDGRATADTATGIVFYQGTSINSGAAISAYVAGGNVFFYSTSGGAFDAIRLNEVNGTYDWIISFTYDTDE